MAERIVSYKLEAALIGLLDDPSPLVQEALGREFQRLGQVGVSLLQKAARDDDLAVREAAGQHLSRLIAPDPGRLLVEYIRGLRYDLETGLYLINRVVHPELQVGAIKDPLDRIATRCRELRVAPMSPREQCKLINRVLFHEFGFRGNYEDYQDPLNSCLEVVLRRRKGIPITLSAVYLLVGLRMGLELEPIGLPGHFLVGCFQEQEPFYIDPFERGRLRSVQEIGQLLESQHLTPQLHHIAPQPVGEVLCRVCRNLVAHFESRRQAAWAGRFRAFVREFEQTHRRRSEA